MPKIGHKKHHKKHPDVIIQIDNTSLEDEKENTYDIEQDSSPADGGAEDWEDDDPRWGNPPIIGTPTIVNVKILINQLQDLDTVRGMLNVRIGVWCNWKDARLAGRSRMDPLPNHLWSPRPTIGEALGDFARRTCEFTIQIGTLEGAMYNLTWFEGNIKNPMDLHMFPLDTDTIEITFFASECYKRNGEINVNYKTDYRMLFDGWMFMAPENAPYGWKLISTTVQYVWDEHCQDVLQIRLNIARSVSFYFFKVAVPLILITCLNFMGFYLETLGERLANNVSLFLSALALLYVVGQDLPHTTFLTAIDKIVLVTLMLIFITSIHFISLWRDSRFQIKAVELNKAKNLTIVDENEDVLTIQEEINNIENETIVVLTYFFVFLGYLLIEVLRLLFCRFKICKEFKKNLNDERVFLNGVDEHNKHVKEDTSYQIPAWIFVDPFKIVLVKQNDSRALIVPQLQTKATGIVKLLLSSGKAVVLSSKPDFKFDGKDVKWMTIGSPLRVMEVVFAVDSCIKVNKTFNYINYFVLHFQVGLQT